MRSPRRDPAIGLHYSLSNFSQAPVAIGQVNHGYALSYLDGIAGKYDYMVQGGSLSANYSLGEGQTGHRNLLHAIHVLGLRRFFADTVFINPFIGAGPGISLYKERFSPALLGGAGFQLRLAGTIFLHTQLHYQVNFSASINNSVVASIGLLGTILQRKKRSRIIAPRVPGIQQQPTDTDGDGIADTRDACPTAPGPAAFQGCPDTDRDGIPDNRDQCPIEPGTVAYNGCPVPATAPPAAMTTIDTLPVTAIHPIDTNSISTILNELAQSIYFETNQAVLSPGSIQALDTIAALLRTQPFRLLQIEGHTDNTGTTKRNEQLSAERANAVLDYLTRAGMDRKKITARGFGATRPVAGNNTAAGRARNRRTVFVLYP